MNDIDDWWFIVGWWLRTLPISAVGCIRSIHASKVLGTSSILLPLLPVLPVVMLLESLSSTYEDEGDDGCVCDVGGNGGRGWAKGSL